ncbi:hypothetical protein FISHEDRAFT_75259 [Fistulina hepatica ATCC 64428]|uniref:Uncharacterized protein n=1 Tax=Fistulina hepatica ATCC 64428 TaxID=1128425 RepID=A0A0D7A761_9AGAR|nr:hypothetical protein FISHEDRAFT_75259 [Fistulina hepatica ATCC 64428]
MPKELNFTNLCKDLQEQMKSVEKAVDIAVDLVHYSSTTMSFDFFNLRRKTYPVVQELSNMIAEMVGNIYSTVDIVFVAISSITNAAYFRKNGRIESTPFESATSQVLSTLPSQCKATLDMLPRVHQALKSAEVRLLEILSFPSGVPLSLLRVVPKLLLPPHVSQRVETLGHLPLLLPSIGISLDSMARMMHQLCTLVLAVFSALDVPRLREREHSPDYREKLDKLHFILYMTDCALRSVTKYVFENTANAFHATHILGPSKHVWKVHHDEKTYEKT